MLAKALALLAVGGLTAFSATVTNGGFESGDLTGWTVLQTNPTPVVDTSNPNSGTYSLHLGTAAGPEPLGDGSIYQNIGIVTPGDLLSFWYRTFTTDTITFDWQDAYITNSAGGTILATIFHQDTSNLTWQQQTFDLTPWVGQAIGVEFLVHQDGFGDDTSMNVDDVAVLHPTPEPFSAGLSITGLGAIIVAIRRKRSSQSN